MKVKEAEPKVKKAEGLKPSKGVSPVKQKRKVPLGGPPFGSGGGSFPDFVYNGGPVIHNPLVYNIFLGDWSSSANQTRATRLNQFVTDLMNSNYMNMLAQYGCGSTGTLVNSVFIASNNHDLLDSDFHTIIQNAIDNNTLPEPVANSSIVFIIFLDDNSGVDDTSLGIVMCEASSDDAFGYHFNFTTTAGNTCFYAVVPGLTDTCLTQTCSSDSSCSLHLAQTREQRQTQVVSHEFSEMITNPDVLNNEAWSRPGSPHENGDICNGSSGNITVGANTWNVQQMYSKFDDQQSNGATTCVLGSSFPLPSLLPACTVMLDRSMYGKDEIDARLAQENPANVDAAFYVAIDGFTANQLGITSASFSGTPNVGPNITFAPGVSQISASATALSAPDQSTLDIIQRFTWTYRVSFSGDSDFPATPGATNIHTMTADISGISGSADILLVDDPNPFELDGPTSWLSTDLRVFQINEGQSKFGETMGSTPADAPVFIQNVINRLNTGNTAGQSFDNLSLDEDASALELSQSVNGTRVFNFAVAKVRFRSLVADANNVRVFFRTFPASTTSTVYDLNTTYRRGGQAGVIIPKLGVLGGETTTIPFFASPRIDTSSQSMDAQTDAPNVRVISHDGSGNEVVAFYGCWLDINQPSQLQFPINPSPVDGPYTSGRLPIQNLVRNAHQCLVMEIAMDGVNLINSGDTPGSSDKLAQRNLSIVASDNPGSPASHRIPNTFEIKPSLHDLKISDKPDELLIDWGNTPADSEAYIYLPGTSANNILNLANQMYTKHGLTVSDEHTLKTTAGGVTYIPVPNGVSVNYAGLLTIDLPPTVKKGQEFKVVVRQLTNAIGRRITPPPPIGSGNTSVRLLAQQEALIRWRKVVGSFQVNIPVKTKEQMLEPEERLLSVMKWIGESIPATNRWFPVFGRYVQQISDRVKALGGDPDYIYPSPDGEYKKKREGKGEERVHYTGKISGIIYNRYGDFDGFYLDTEDGIRQFTSHETDMEALIKQAWAERILLTVIVERDDVHRPESVVLLSTPKPSHHWN